MTDANYLASLKAAFIKLKGPLETLSSAMGKELCGIETGDQGFAITNMHSDALMEGIRNKLEIAGIGFEPEVQGKNITFRLNADTLTPQKLGDLWIALLAESLNSHCRNMRTEMGKEMVASFVSQLDPNLVPYRMKEGGRSGEESEERGRYK